MKRMNKQVEKLEKLYNKIETKIEDIFEKLTSSNQLQIKSDSLNAHYS